MDEWDVLHDDSDFTNSDCDNFALEKGCDYAVSLPFSKTENKEKKTPVTRMRSFIWKSPSNGGLKRRKSTRLLRNPFSSDKITTDFNEIPFEKNNSVSYERAPTVDLNVTMDEWKLYHQWLLDVIHLDIVDWQTISLRLSLFLFFLRSNIPIEDITREQIKSRREWNELGRKIDNNTAQFVFIPLDKNFSSTWWFDSSVIPDDLQTLDSYYACHISHTKPFPHRLTRKEMQRHQKLVFYSALATNEPTPILCSLDPKLERLRLHHIDWAVKLMVSKDNSIPYNLKVAACKRLCSLIWPVEKVPGLKEFIWNKNVVKTILNMSRNGDVELHTHIPMQALELEHVVGDGASGKVCLAIVYDDNVAVKLCDEISIAFTETDFRFEVALMSILKHPNILPCIGAHLYGPTFFYTSPYKAFGSLRMLLDDRTQALSWTRKIHIAYQISCGLEYLHSFGIIHRDIKSENILIDDDWSVTIADFGTSCFEEKDYSLENMVGTSEWIAPEMYDGFYDKKVDVYSFGIVLYEIFTRNNPYYEIKNHWEVADHVLSGNRPIFTQKEIPFIFLRKLMQKCWQTNYKKRPSFKTISTTLYNYLESFRKNQALESSLPPKSEQDKFEKEEKNNVPSFLGYTGPETKNEEPDDYIPAPQGFL